MKPDQYFFRYAFPCAEVLLQLKRISQQRFDDLKFAAENNITPSREILEDTYKVAFENLMKIANDMKKDYWDIEVIKKYFEEDKHNEFINTGHGTFGNAPESMKDMCRVITAVIEEIKGHILKVKYDGKERMCRNIYNLKLKQGDKVRVHYGYVVEKA
ncbi:hypothetical protein ACFL6I_13960 [candidate division KSB1 bacterium]